MVFIKKKKKREEARGINNAWFHKKQKKRNKLP